MSHLEKGKMSAVSLVLYKYIVWHFQFQIVIRKKKIN